MASRREEEAGGRYFGHPSPAVPPISTDASATRPVLSDSRYSRQYHGLAGDRHMAENIEQELAAIKSIVEALEPLDADARQRALVYATQSLGIKPTSSQVAPQLPRPPGVDNGGQDHAPRPPIVTDIRSLKDQKQPSTDIEMATLVAYYLKYEAPKDERKDEIGTEDIDIYFVQAGYPLPNNKAYTLPNAKKAGYLENASRGKYKLNSVGHNLVAHNLPRSGGESAPKPRKKNAKSATKRKSSKKKSAKSKPKSRG